METKMKVLVATKNMQGLRNTDMFYCNNGEIVIPDFRDRSLGSSKGFFEEDEFHLIGIDTRKAVTTFEVIVLDYTFDEILQRIKGSFLDSDMKYRNFNKNFYKKFLRIAYQFEICDICEITKGKISKRNW